ncbi:hypothetical protein CHS0354_041771 [Potamilus streckersoni]|uniref:sn-1-specific diacylglycerol lipase n=1 Tax=Potamilus streckersoni TaxID=2493646 RepID=A0AAE0T1M3_9BIVA|nr:hypothetical protein CHS0354_041771 [Potamilus streckersoni]
MPQLVAFGRRWTIGSDDLVFPGLMEIGLRIIWVVAVSVVFHHHKDAFECSDGNLLYTYIVGLLSLLCLNILTTAVIVYTSMKGSITFDWPRRHIPKLLYIKFTTSLPEVAWNIIGTYWAFRKFNGCDLEVVPIVKGVVITGWIIAVVVTFGIAIVFDPLGGQKDEHSRKHAYSLESDDREQAIIGAKTAASKIWEYRFRVLCCCVCCDEQSTDAFSGISKIFSDFFKGVDLVPTDIAAGLILVYREQERKNNRLSIVTIDHDSPPARSQSSYTFSQPTLQSSAAADMEISSSYSANGLVISPGPSLLGGQTQTDIPKPWMTIRNMTHYMKYAMASYGWPLYIFSHLATGACHLWSQCRCCSCIDSRSDVLHDNCCQCHTAAIKKFTNIHADDLVYVSFHNQIFEIPFFVAIDREDNAVVVAIRGTLSLRDVLTDFNAECEELTIEGLSDTCITHKGILQAARYVHSVLQRLHILDRAFEQAQQGAKLVITGHSLGAGAAALLSILLRPQYPDLICFPFSTPGGLMSLNASKYTQEFMCSVILGKDLVPRLGISTMEDLKANILQALHNCDLPKYKILASGMWQAFCGLSKPSEEKLSFKVQQPLLSNISIHRSYTNTQNNVRAALQDAMMASEQSHITHPTLYPPGKILHILEKETSARSCFGIPDYYAMWSRPEEFTEVIVSPKMLSDHLPDVVMRALQQLEEKNYAPRPPSTQPPTALSM